MSSSATTIVHPEKTFFTSDLHFFHKNILKFQPNRAAAWGSVKEMNYGIVQNINETVGPDGILYHLGDWSFGKSDETARLMSLIRVDEVRFILGNHDNADRMRTLIRMAEALGCTTKFVLLGHYAELRFPGSDPKKDQAVVLFHYGCRVWNKSHHGSFLLFGHSHGSLPPYGRSVDVGLDSAAVTGKHQNHPFSWAQVEAFLSARPIETPDHHAPGNTDH